MPSTSHILNSSKIANGMSVKSATKIGKKIIKQKGKTRFKHHSFKASKRGGNKDKESSIVLISRLNISFNLNHLLSHTIQLHLLVQMFPNLAILF